jgi:N-acetylneuraminic acid mutarotase
MPGGRHHAMAAGLDGRLYVFGGACIPACINGSDTAWVYDPVEDAWRELAPMPERRTAGAAVALEGFLYVVGGTGDTGDLLRYDPGENAWTRLAPLLERREHTAAVAVEGEIYALGGRWLVEMNSVEIYDPGTDAWRTVRPMFTARAGHGAAVLDGKIHVLGGEVFLSTPSPVTLDSVEVLDPVTGVWRSAGTLPTPLHGLPAAVYEGVLYALGGSSRAAGIANQGRVYGWRP